MAPAAKSRTIPALLSALICWICTAAASAGSVTVSNANLYFNDLGERLLQQQLGRSITNVQIAPTNEYTAPVHRIFQVTANVIEAMNTNAFPNVFRPQFTERNGAIYLAGFTHDNLVSTLGGWLSANSNCIPLVIGARRGLPNFNEATLRTDVMITRKLQLLRATTNSLPSLTNQMYVMQFSNHVGVESWNAYISTVPFESEIEVSNILTVTLTNHLGTQASQTFVLAGQTNLPTWPGGTSQWPASGFVLPLMSPAVLLSNAAYRFGNNTFQHGSTSVYEDARTLTVPFALPEWHATVSNHLVYIHKTGTNLLDFVILRNTWAYDLGSNLSIYGPSPPTAIGSVWSTARRFGSNGPTEGIRAQIQYSQVGGDSSEWRAFSTFSGDRNAAAQAFRQFVLGNPIPPLAAETPFNPIARLHHITTWQANDPLVHYHPGDLRAETSTNWVTWAQQRFNLDFSSITNLNKVYAPWGNEGGRVSNDPDSLNSTLRDPLVSSPNEWDFPTAALPSANWLGKVHRGTPWQTIYLKSSGPYASAWNSQAGYKEHNPTNDWKLALLIAADLSTNTWREQVSVNDQMIGSWARVLDGFRVLTNTVPPDEAGSRPPAFDTLTVESNAPQIAVFRDGINASRNAQRGGYFPDAASLFSAPVLSTESPWLNVSHPRLTQYGISDEAYEAVPSQLLGLILADAVGRIVSSDSGVSLSFNGCVPGSYSVQVSTDLQAWSDLPWAFTATNGTFSVDLPSASGQLFFKARRID